MAESARLFVAECIDNLLELQPDYAARTLAQRCPGQDACGSIWNTSHTWEELKSCNWRELKAPSGTTPGCRYFKATGKMMGGVVGIVNLADLNPDVQVTLDDRKNTGYVSATVKSSSVNESQLDHVDYTVLITGEEQGKQVVFTVHPGDPIKPSQVAATPEWNGKQCAVSEARAMGLATAKIDWH